MSANSTSHNLSISQHELVATTDMADTGHSVKAPRSIEQCRSRKKGRAVVFGSCLSQSCSRIVHAGLNVTVSLKIVLNPSLPPSCWDCRYALLSIGYVTVMNEFLEAFPLVCFQWTSLSNFKHKVNLHVRSLPKLAALALYCKMPLSQ